MRNASDPINQLRPDQFLDLYRLSSDMVRYLVHELSPYMPYGGRYHFLRSDLRILAALFFYANGSYQQVVGQSWTLSMSQPSISRCIEEVSVLLVERLSGDGIKFPTTEEEILQEKFKFMRTTNFPGTIGATDCTQIAILAPSVAEHVYFCCKQFHSKNVQIICSSDLRILSINSRYPGAAHDSFIWQNSAVAQEMERRFNAGDETTWLVGDFGYTQAPWLMTIVPDAEPASPEDRYNTAQKNARNCIERLNAVLKTRFRCLLREKVLRYDPQKVGYIINACAILHNMCVSARLDNLQHEVDNFVAGHEEQELPQPVRGNNAPYAMQGVEARNAIIRRYFT